jgi:hypothetical protein
MKDSKMKTLLQPSQRTLSFSLRKPTYAEAQQIVKGKVFTMNGYFRFRKSHPQYNLPANPNAYYKEWVSSYEFLGTPVKSGAEYCKEYWAKVKSGEIVHNGRGKTKSIAQNSAETSKTTFKATVKIKEANTEFEDKQAFINLAKKLGIYDQFKPAFRTLFTYDELLDLVKL